MLLSNLQCFPSSSAALGVLRLEDEDSVRRQFMNNLKEATWLLNGDLSTINDLSQRDVSELWAGIATSDFSRYYAVASKIRTKATQSSSDVTSAVVAGNRHVPIRLYTIDNGLGSPPLIDLVELGKSITLKDAVKTIVGSDQQTNKKFIIQGVEIPPETPVDWLTTTLSHPDNWLYIIAC